MNAQGWGGGWGSGGGDDDSGSEDVSLESSSTQEAKPAPPKITVEAIGTHYDDEPAAHYEPEYVNQDTNISLLHGDELVIQRPYLRQADVKFRRRIWRVIDLRQKLNKAWTWPRSPISQVFWELGTKGLVRAYYKILCASYYLHNLASNRNTLVVPHLSVVWLYWTFLHLFCF